jgi:hypothetical protein
MCQLNDLSTVKQYCTVILDVSSAAVGRSGNLPKLLVI